MAVRSPVSCMSTADPRSEGRSSGVHGGSSRFAIATAPRRFLLVYAVETEREAAQQARTDLGVAAHGFVTVGGVAATRNPTSPEAQGADPARAVSSKVGRTRPRRQSATRMAPFGSLRPFDGSGQLDSR